MILLITLTFISLELTIGTRQVFPITVPAPLATPRSLVGSHDCFAQTPTE